MDGQTRYRARDFRVCLVVRYIFGIDDPSVLMAAALHDAIKDTPTVFDDLEEHFGRQAVDWAAAMCKGTRRQDERGRKYVANLTTAPWQVTVCARQQTSSAT
jgi:(p)ppGpp synthase/HD superfamily hydrolase